MWKALLKRMSPVICRFGFYSCSITMLVFPSTLIVKDIWIELVSAPFPSQTQYCVYVNGICVSDTSTIQLERVSATHKVLVALHTCIESGVNFFSPEFLLFHPMIKSPLHSFYGFVIFFLTKCTCLFCDFRSTESTSESSTRHSKEF